jgi:hypothetical protein
MPGRFPAIRLQTARNTGLRYLPHSMPQPATADIAGMRGCYGRLLAVRCQKRTGSGGKGQGTPGLSVSFGLRCHPEGTFYSCQLHAMKR